MQLTDASKRADAALARLVGAEHAEWRLRAALRRQVVKSREDLIAQATGLRKRIPKLAGQAKIDAQDAYRQAVRYRSMCDAAIGRIDRRLPGDRKG